MSFLARTMFRAAQAVGRSSLRTASSSFKQSTSTLTFARRSYHSNSNNAFKQSSASTSSFSGSSLGVGIASAVAIAAYLLNKDEDEVAKCCGIVAFVGEEPAVGYLLEGLHILQNRGYDSAGVATIHTTDKGESTIKTTKMASRGSTSDSINILKAEAPPVHARDTVGIAHTRWATHGGKTDENAHPHSDMKNRLALVHNGTIENSHDLKHELEATGLVFKSQTDTEVIAQLLGFYLDSETTADSHQNIMRALEKTLGRLEGTWGLAIIYNQMPGQIIAARHGSPLVVGIGSGKMFLASELSAFGRHTSQYISLNDGEVAVLKAGAHTLDMSRLAIAPHEHIELSPAPFLHWTIKEICEQPEAIARALNYGARFDGDGMVKLGGLESNSDMLLKVRHLVIAACGTSLFAGSYGALLFKALKCFDTVQTIDASEVNADSYPTTDGGVLVLSQSGETKDTHRAVVLASDSLIPTLSVVNAVGSLIARTTGCGVYVNAGREHAVASTKAFTTQVTALALIAGWYAQKRDNKGTHFQRRNELNQAIHRLPIYTGMTLRVREQCAKIAEQIKTQEHMFVLGKGYSEPIAREGALKIKEITYAHAEGYGGGALKHGPFALLVEGTPVILLIMDDQHAELMRIAAQEVKARGANIIVITDKKSLAESTCKPENIITIPSNGPLTALLATIPLQLLAYELALKRGIDPDKPRNLAKAVTVD